MVFSSLSKYKNAGLLVMRVGLGIAMSLHGYPKIMGGVARWRQLGEAMHIVHIHFFPVFWGFMAAATEFIGGILLILGLAFRITCLLLCFEMAIALLGHLSGGFSEYSHALELLIVFAGLFIIGAGRYSVDKK